MIELITKPTKAHLSQIETWLIDERKEYREGFYCNWNIIYDGFKEECLYFLVENNQAIGFVLWYSYQKNMRLDIVEIKREKRGLGLGRIMVEKSLKTFKDNNHLSVTLECSPVESEPIWRKLGFIDYKMNEYISKPIKFKVLILSQEQSSSLKITPDDFYIELWNEEPFQARKKDANWSWIVTPKKECNEVVLPVIFPANQNWRIRCSLGKEILYDGKIKHRKDEDKIHVGSFLVIEEYENLLEKNQ